MCVCVCVCCSISPRRHVLVGRPRFDSVTGTAAADPAAAAAAAGVLVARSDDARRPSVVAVGAPSVRRSSFRHAADRDMVANVTQRAELSATFRQSLEESLMCEVQRQEFNESRPRTQPSHHPSHLISSELNRGVDPYRTGGTCLPQYI